MFSRVLKKNLLLCFRAAPLLLPALLYAQNSSLPLHNLPLCTASGSQSAPLLLADQAQGAWVIWEDARSTRTMLYAQRLDSLGHPKLQNNGLALTTTTGKQTNFAATGDASGGFIVVWQEVTSDDGDILAQRFGANGQRLWGLNGKEIYRGSKEQGAPQVIGTGEGDAYVFWHDQRNGSQDLFGQRINENGEKLWHTEGVELVNTRRAQTLGAAVVIPERGFALAWQDDNTTPAQVLVQYFDHTGKAQWNNPVRVAQSSGEQSEPRMLFEAGANNAFALHVVCLDKRFNALNVYAQKIDATGALLWGGAGIAAGLAAGAQKEIQLLREGAGGLFVVWEDARNDKGDLFAQRFDSAGKTLWTTTGVALAQAEQGQFRPRIASDQQGGLIAVWEDERGSGTNIYAQRINALGQQVWQQGGVVLTDHGKKNTQAYVLTLAGPRAWATWMDERNGSVDVFAQALTSDGNFENVPPRFLSVPEPSAFVDALYTYSIEALDYDAEAPPILQLMRAPAWLQLHATSRQLEGMPSSNDVGEAQIELHAVDNDGGRATQSFQLKIAVDTSQPRITSQPDTLAQEDERYVYQVKAEDPNPQETLRYSLESNANWLTLFAQGELAGIPSNDHVGMYALKVVVTNSKGKSAQQQFSLRVANVNDPPLLANTPPPRAVEGGAYSFRFTATEIDKNDALTFGASLKPAWLLLDSNGAASGTPTRTNLADTVLTVYVEDRAGARDQKNFSIPIDLKNTKPVISSAPKTTTPEDSLYLYQIVVVDPDPNETLTIALTQAPSWLQLNANTKQLQGTPRNEHVGTHAVALEARDSKGERAQQQFSLRVENTNDAPFFTSTPDTIAPVDSLYIYKPLAQDIDAADRQTFAVLATPTWLTWHAATQTLRGSPKFTDVGTTQVRLRVTDLNNASATQSFNLRVLDLGVPDNSAPASPQSLLIAPARWNATAQFTVQWQNPFDPSKIAGVYYKIGAAPNSPRDGVLVRSSANEPVREIQVQAPSEGAAPIYVWLLDGRENVDHKTAARVDYHYDRTAPQAPSALRVLNNNGSTWVAHDTIHFVWQAATDALSGLASYTFNLDEKVVGQLASSATKFTFTTALKEGAHTYQVVAVDSAGNRRASPRLNFRIDRTPPRLSHTALDTITLGQPLLLRAQASDVSAGVENVRVQYRNAGEKSFREAIMNLTSGEYSTNLAAGELRATGFEYVVSVRDSAGNVALSASLPRTMHSAVVRAEQVDAPNATRGEFYQLVSVPYSIKSDSNLAWLQDDLGAYEQTSWRLYSYHPASGNIEFGKSGFINFAPGRALWLITAERKNFDLAATQSISTAQAFDIELQPGWNLIATPFAFPTDWSTVQKSSFVEAQLWSFDGKQYVADNTVLQPWQGYFVRNRNTIVEKISILPSLAQTSLPVSADNFFRTRAESGRALSLASQIEREVLPPARAPQYDPVQWHLQIRVSNGKFVDHANWLGVSSLAQEEWDELEWSEPPSAPGDFVALRFNQTAWQRFAGAYTTDFRPPRTFAQSWRFEILSGTEGQKVELIFAHRGTRAEQRRFVLIEEESRFARAIEFDEDGKSLTTLAFRSKATPQRFILWAGTHEQLVQQGITNLIAPTAYALAPVYPNPARASTEQNAMSTFRFSLPQASTVELRIFDVLGRQVRSLALKQIYAAGYHEIIWDGRDEHGNAVAAGIYWYRMTAPGFHAARKMMVLRQ